MMAGFRPVALYGLTIPPGEDPVPAFALNSYPATFKLTMAALDPFAKAEENETTEEVKFTGATLRIIRIPMDEDDDEDEDSEDDDYDLLNGLADDDDDDDAEDEDDEDINGGPSDSSKSKKVRNIEALRQALAETKESMDLDESPKLSAKAKGKAKAIDVDGGADEEEDGDEDEDEDEEDEDGDDYEEMEGPEEFVLCTLDPSKNYQQSLDITINEYETVYFQVSGTHAVFLTGNILVPDEGEDYGSEDDEEEEEDEYDLTPDDDELGLPDSEDEEDELDDLEDPRITELDDLSDLEDPTSDLEVPALVNVKKGKNKRSAPDSADTSMVDDLLNTTSVDDILAKSLKPADATVNGEAKLSKKQKKKLKANAGHAVDAPATAALKEDTGIKAGDAVKPSPKGDKKVQFSKTLIQGPTPSTSMADSTKGDTAKNEATKKGAELPKTNGASAKPSFGVREVQGVTLDDKKIGTGPVAKNGSKVSMRYIGKLADTKQQFDANKKGKPFTFTLGKGEVIKGWDIGVAGMSAGGERRITIPAHLAYGTTAMPGIPANSKLVFDVKALEIK